MNNKIVIKEAKKYLVFDYQDINQINNLLNVWYRSNKTIILDKKVDNIIIKLEKSTYNIIDKEVSLDEDLNKLIDFLQIVNNVRITIKNNIIKLYSNNYNSIFDNVLLKENEYYVFNLKKEELLYKEIAKYNKYTSISNTSNIDNTFTKFTLSQILELINKEINSITITNKNNKIELQIDNNLFIFNNKNMFKKIFLPEILNSYSELFEEYNISINHQFNNCLGNINNNLNFINFKEDEIRGYYNYINNNSIKNNYKLDLASNYNFIKEKNEPSPIYNYSYGYISILFISLMISIITIIIALLNI